MKTSDIEELLLKSGKSAYQAGPLNEETEENTQYGRLPKAYVTDGIFVKPAKEDMKVKVNYTDIVWIEAENNNCRFIRSSGVYDNSIAFCFCHSISYVHPATIQAVGNRNAALRCGMTVTDCLD